MELQLRGFALLAVVWAAGSATGRGEDAAAATEAIARNPGWRRIFISMLLALGFMEALTLFVFALFLLFKVCTGIIGG